MEVCTQAPALQLDFLSHRHVAQALRDYSMQEQEQANAMQVSGDQAQKDEQERQREQEQAAKLLECEKLFTQPDSIMEPGILDVLSRYLHLGGSAQNGVDFLIDKYVGKQLPPIHIAILCFPHTVRCVKPSRLHAGYGQMASLVCSWIAKADHANEHTTMSHQADEVTHMQVSDLP